jgi:glycosyltransferase involved in cell wall biosynthesis
MRATRPLRITWVLPGFAARPGGGYRVVYRYANLLAERGHEVCVVHAAWLQPWQYARPLDPRREPRNALRAVVDLSRPRPRGPGWEVIDPRVRLTYVPTLAPRNIPEGDVVIATAWRTAESVARYPASRGEKAYFLQHLETWDAPAQRVEATWRLPLRKFAIAEWLVREGKRITDDPIVHIPNAIDPETFACRNPVERRPERVAMLASTAPIKGLDVGLAVLEGARRARPELRAVLFGVQRRSTTIPAWIDYERAPPLATLVDEIYNGSCAYLCPSRGEGWHLPPAEAMACGCAVVSTAIDGVADYTVDGENALLAPVDDIEALTEALVRVLADGALRTTLARNGMTTMSSFSWQRSTDRLEAELVELAGE